MSYILGSISNKSKDLESHLTARIAKSCLLPHKCHRSNSQPTIQHNSYILQMQQNHRSNQALFWCLNLVNIAATLSCALVAIFPLNAPMPAIAPPLGLLLSMPDSSQLKRSEGRVEGLSVNLQTTLFIIIISKTYLLFLTNHIYITYMPINSKIDQRKGRNPKKIDIKRKQTQQWRKKTKTGKRQR